MQPPPHRDNHRPTSVARLSRTQQPVLRGVQPPPGIVGERWHRPKSAAAYTGMSERTLERMRQAGGGPEFAKQGRIILYPESGLDAWLRARLFASTSAETVARGDAP